MRKGKKTWMFLLFLVSLTAAIFGIMALDSDSWAWATVVTYAGTIGSYIFGSEIGIFN